MKSDPAPNELVEALLRGESAARACLERWCRSPIDRLVGRVAGPRPGQDCAALVGRTLRWAEMYLRSRGPSAYRGMGRAAFIAAVCAAAYRVLAPPAPGDGPAGAAARPGPGG